MNTVLVNDDRHRAGRYVTVNDVSARLLNNRSAEAYARCTNPEASQRIADSGNADPGDQSNVVRYLLVSDRGVEPEWSAILILDRQVRTQASKIIYCRLGVFQHHGTWERSLRQV